jgi:hypothetical protein
LFTVSKIKKIPVSLMLDPARRELFDDVEFEGFETEENRHESTERKIKKEIQL